jgi:hypothetical protein
MQTSKPVIDPAEHFLAVLCGKGMSGRLLGGLPGGGRARLVQHRAQQHAPSDLDLIPVASIAHIEVLDCS